jgi:hypothetical protein
MVLEISTLSVNSPLDFIHAIVIISKEVLSLNTLGVQLNWL